MFINLITILVPCLNDKVIKTLNKALFYSKKAYEEAQAAKEFSLRIEAIVNNFKDYLCKQTDNSNAGLFSNKFKSSNKMQQFWHIVRYFRLISLFNFYNLTIQLQFNRL